jgi:Ca2+-binding RTX toxin-like protein
MALPVVELLFGFPDLDPTNYFFDAIYDGVFGTATSTSLPLVTTYGAKVVFKGDFIVDGAGVVTGGTMTGFKVFAGRTKVETGSGYDISATELIAAVETWQTTSSEPLEELLLDIPTKYLGSELGDFIFGIEGAGTVFLGRQGDDELFANSGDITLKGGKGNDLLLAQEGLCWYSGGQGQDVFGFVDPALGNKIKDFNAEDDRIRLDPVTFVGVELGALGDSQFKIGKQASTEDQIILYQRGKGNIWFDQDGSGDVYDPIKFAKIDKGLDLTAQNFFSDEPVILA